MFILPGPPWGPAFFPPIVFIFDYRIPTISKCYLIHAIESSLRAF